MSLFSLAIDIAKMNPALSTALQSWSRRKLLIIVSFLIAAHIAVFFMGVIVAPSMFHDANVPGTVCVKQDPPESNSGKEIYKASMRHWLWPDIIINKIPAAFFQNLFRVF